MEILTALVFLQARGGGIPSAGGQCSSALITNVAQAVGLFAWL